FNVAPRDEDVWDVAWFEGKTHVTEPERAAFQAAADAIGVDLNDCVMIDDDIMNVRAAVEYNMIGILHTAIDRTAVEIQSLFDVEAEF
ncbi:hypothetical protein L2U97_13645, partial [Staphylococcus aureus]|nr:hypothetical protein [Staphylococcus aureus]